MIKRILQWLGVIALLAVVTGVAFSLYAHFLVDYSLENLEMALAVSQKDTQDISPLKNNLYGSVVKDLLIEEAAKEDLDFKNLILLDLASRSFSESGREKNRDRTEFYLTHVMDKKLPARSVILRATDILYRAIATAYRSVLSLSQYFRKAFSSKEEKALQVSSLLLLNQAQEKEREWQLDEAAQYYQKYLELYPNLPDRALVTVSLSQVFIKQKKWNSAEKLLRGIQLAYAGTEESVLATNLLKKIDNLRKRQPFIDKYRRFAEGETGQKREEAQFKLALEYLYSYSIENAEKLFKALENSTNSSLRQKAKFYLGWIYKLRSQYDMSAEILEKLQQEQVLDPELEIGLGAQLAHVYTEKESEKEALSQYEKISEKAPLVNLKDSAIWRSVAAVEQANLYYLTEEDVESADRQVNALRNFLPISLRDSLLENAKTVSSAETRDRGFDYLLTQEPDRALPFFERALRQNPKDAWARAGIAAVYVLRNDKDRAKEAAEQAHQMRSDEYTSSMLAYVYSLMGEYDQAASYYETALRENPRYIAGRFNLAHAYLRLERYDEARDLLTELDQSFGAVRNTIRSKILNNMGYALWWLGERAKAEDRFREAVAITPDLAEAKINLDKISAGLMPERVNAPQPINPKE